MEQRRLVVLLLLAGATGVWAGTGPIVPERSADVVLDSFEASAAAYQVTPRGGVVCKLSLRSGVARQGTNSLLLEMDPAPNDAGRHTVLLNWRFPTPQDWSGSAGVSLWVQAHGDPPPTIRPSITEAGGASYWARDTELMPRREGEWQLLEIPFSRFEVWNEPVPYAYWMGSMESIVKLHQVTYQAIKGVDPEARVLGPCPYTFLWDFLEEFFKAGGNRWVDDVVVHAYDSQPPDVNLASNVRRLRELMARYGLQDRDVYITELGYPTPRVTEQEQARYLVRAFVYGLAEGVRVLVWHMLWDWSGTLDPENYTGDPGYALVRFERSPRPAYAAYAVMTRMLENARFVGPVAGLWETQRGFEFERRGQRIYVLWDTAGASSTVHLTERAPQVTRVEMTGAEGMLQPARPGEYDVPIGQDVCYVVAQ